MKNIGLFIQIYILDMEHREEEREKVGRIFLAQQ
jgi:hypothetical protein